MTLQKKYIPKSWGEICGQKEVVSILSSYTAISSLPHFMFIGPPGVGKTASAYVLAKSLNMPIIELNASDERGIDTIREKIKTMLFTSGARLILMDEFDSTTEPAQAALRRPMEQALQRTNNRLILTVNRPWRVIDAISSRCTNLYFKPLNKEALTIIAHRVLKREGLKFKDKAEIINITNALVNYSKGDARKLLDVIDNYSHSKESLIQYIQKKSAETNQIREIFQASINGEWQEALMKLESFIIQQPTTNNSEIVEQFYTEVKELNIPPIHKFEIYKRLADTERSLKVQCSPLVQISGFLASVMAIVHFKEK